MRQWKNLVQAAQYQIYISRSRDPFLNLSIEHYFLQKTKPDATILFLYANSPCVVIGRNQNPWLEIDLGLLKTVPGVGLAQSTGLPTRGNPTAPSLKDVQLVRRRSGGGTVFHDEGNVNYSVICPQAAFTRDKHAEMVTKAIRTYNDRARVNERHDIVLDRGEMLDSSRKPVSTDMHRTQYHCHGEEGKGPPLKVSGSAYKMTRNRVLHHGTCLLTSPDLESIARYLHSPARPFMKARGVDSVRSPVGNVFPDSKHSGGTKNYLFQLRVIEAFKEMYGIEEHASHAFSKTERSRRKTGDMATGENWVAGFVGDEMAEIEEIRDGIRELKVSDMDI